MKNVQIIILGAAGTGKTTLATKIAEVLRENDVVVGHMSDADHPPRTHERNEAALRGLKHQLRVSIFEEQAQREAPRIPGAES